MGCLPKGSLFNITVYTWLAFKGIKVKNWPRLSQAAAWHLQIVSFKKQGSGFLFLPNKTFYPKKVFQTRFPVVLLGNVFAPGSPSAPGWFAQWEDMG